MKLAYIPFVLSRGPDLTGGRRDWLHVSLRNTPQFVCVRAAARTLMAHEQVCPETPLCWWCQHPVGPRVQGGQRTARLRRRMSLHGLVTEPQYGPTACGSTRTVPVSPTHRTDQCA
jgi:hypothetical protein